MAALPGRTNEIAFIDGADDQMTACLDGLHLTTRLLPLRERDGEASQAPPTLPAYGAPPPEGWRFVAEAVTRN